MQLRLAAPDTAQPEEGEPDAEREERASDGVQLDAHLEHLFWMYFGHQTTTAIVTDATQRGSST